jgi:methylenetetrahydrofolate reductase (NADPH)
MTKIAELLAAGPTYSVEFMPPRTDEMLRHLEKTLRELEPLKPSFCSVTYGAGGSTRDRTLEAVMHIHHGTQLVAMPHLTCVGQSRAEIDALVQRYLDEGIENLLALAGDPPKEIGAEGDFRFATELIELARGKGAFSIGVAAFPEVHPQSPSREEDRRRLAIKLSQAEFGITQFFWTVDHYLRMRDELDALGCATPVIPSVFLALSAEAAHRYTLMNGAEWPSWLADRFDAVSGDEEGVRQVGVEVATEIASRLLAEGVPGLHLYTLNRSRSILELWSNLDLRHR